LLVDCDRKLLFFSDRDDLDFIIVLITYDKDKTIKIRNNFPNFFVFNFVDVVLEQLDATALNFLLLEKVVFLSVDKHNLLRVKGHFNFAVIFAHIVVVNHINLIFVFLGSIKMVVMFTAVSMSCNIVDTDLITILFLASNHADIFLIRRRG
tara:strand:+ start:1260 stop:1712 length:453 start_codon:yes stop_codon:yes gene_type:complete